MREATKAQEAAEQRALAAEAAVAREAAAREEAEKREVEAVAAAAAVREAEWQRAAERTAFQREELDELPSGCRVRERASTLDGWCAAVAGFAVMCGCRMALRGRAPFGGGAADS